MSVNLVGIRSVGSGSGSEVGASAEEGVGAFRRAWQQRKQDISGRLRSLMERDLDEHDQFFDSPEFVPEQITQRLRGFLNNNDVGRLREYILMYIFYSDSLDSLYAATRELRGESALCEGFFLEYFYVLGLAGLIGGDSSFEFGGEGEVVGIYKRCWKEMKRELQINALALVIKPKSHFPCKESRRIMGELSGYFDGKDLGPLYGYILGYIGAVNNGYDTECSCALMYEAILMLDDYFDRSASLYLFWECFFRLGEAAFIYQTALCEQIEWFENFGDDSDIENLLHLNILSTGDAPRVLAATARIKDTRTYFKALKAVESLLDYFPGLDVCLRDALMEAMERISQEPSALNEELRRMSVIAKSVSKGIDCQRAIGLLFKVLDACWPSAGDELDDAVGQRLSSAVQSLSMRNLENILRMAEDRSDLEFLNYLFSTIGSVGGFEAVLVCMEVLSGRESVSYKYYFLEFVCAFHDFNSEIFDQMHLKKSVWMEAIRAQFEDVEFESLSALYLIEFLLKVGFLNRSEYDELFEKFAERRERAQDMEVDFLRSEPLRLKGEGALPQMDTPAEELVMRLQYEVIRRRVLLRLAQRPPKVDRGGDESRRDDVRYHSDKLRRRGENARVYKQVIRLNKKMSAVEFGTQSGSHGTDAAALKRYPVESIQDEIYRYYIEEDEAGMDAYFSSLYEDSALSDLVPVAIEGLKIESAKISCEKLWNEKVLGLDKSRILFARAFAKQIEWYGLVKSSEEFRTLLQVYIQNLDEWSLVFKALEDVDNDWVYFKSYEDLCLLLEDSTGRKGVLLDHMSWVMARVDRRSNSSVIINYFKRWCWDSSIEAFKNLDDHSSAVNVLAKIRNLANEQEQLECFKAFISQCVLYSSGGIAESSNEVRLESEYEFLKSLLEIFKSPDEGENLSAIRLFLNAIHILDDATFRQECLYSILEFVCAFYGENDRFLNQLIDYKNYYLDAIEEKITSCDFESLSLLYLISFLRKVELLSEEEFLKFCRLAKERALEAKSEIGRTQKQIVSDAPVRLEGEEVPLSALSSRGDYAMPMQYEFFRRLAVLELEATRR